MCMEKPIYDLIIGNIPGVRVPEVIESNNGNEKPQKENERLSDVSRKFSVDKREDKLDSIDKVLPGPDEREKVGAVQTRARVAAEHQRKETPLKTPEIKVKDVSPAQFRKDQREDDTLRMLFERVKNGKEIDMKGDGYFEKDGILYKASKQGQEVDSCVVVPTKHREAVMQIAHDSILGGYLGYKKTLDKLEHSFTGLELQQM